MKVDKNREFFWFRLGGQVGSQIDEAESFLLKGRKTMISLFIAVPDGKVPWRPQRIRFLERHICSRLEPKIELPNGNSLWV